MSKLMGELCECAFSSWKKKTKNMSINVPNEVQRFTLTLIKNKTTTHVYIAPQSSRTQQRRKVKAGLGGSAVPSLALPPAGVKLWNSS